MPGPREYEESCEEAVSSFDKGPCSRRTAEADAEPTYSGTPAGCEDLKL